VRLFYAISLVLVCLAIAGCGKGGAKVTGKVSFPDGSPLTKGEVIFQNDTAQYAGAINADGTYIMNGAVQGSGIPNGTYTVYVTGTTVVTATSPDPTLASAPKELVAAEFTSKSKSSLTCEVKGSMTHDIEVKAP
jgi:hypothetical protein